MAFDEIHQLRDPSRLLKAGADLFPKLKILAIGSSTLAASRQFRDTLTGRKRIPAEMDASLERFKFLATI